MELIVARHGETDYNIKGLLQGQRESKLTKRGIKQCEALAEALKNSNIDKIYSSTLKRAVNTAKIVNKYHNIRIKKTKALNEKSWGKLEGKNGKQMRKKNPGKLDNPLFRPEKGENLNDVVERIKPFINKLLFDKSDKTVLIVAHKSPIRALISILLHKKLEDAFKLELDASSISVISINKKARLKVFNNTDHLKKGHIKTIHEVKGIC